ncbi:MAG: YdcF family protein [Nodosilinea sp.]
MLDTLRAMFGMRWTEFSWGLYHWLSSARMVTLTLLVFTAVMLLASAPRFRRRMVILGLTLLGTYWFIVSPLFSIPATRLLTRFVPPDTGETADAVVVLARNSDIQGDRYSTAVAMVKAGRAPRLVIMGRVQGIKVFESLQQQNLSTEGLLSAVCVRTTKQEAYSSAAILGPQDLSRIILITDPPHMLRAWLTFEGLGFSVIPHLEPIPDWVAHHERSFLAIREYLGMLSYAALGRFHQPPQSSLAEVATEIAAEFPADRCLLTAKEISQWVSPG